MTDYEKASLKLQLLACTQRQALISLAANRVTGTCRVSAETVAQEGSDMLDKAVAGIGKLL